MIVKVILAFLFSFSIASPIYLPWVLARFGKYRGWYLARFVPPFTWSRSVYFFPASAFFLIMPFAILVPVEMRVMFINLVGFTGFILAPIIAIWTPRWLKPGWQRYLEDKYSQDSIRAFIPVWREMDKQEWSAYLDSEAGIEELVKITRQKLRQA